MFFLQGMIYSPEGDYLGTTGKLGPLVKIEICALVSGLDDMFLTNLPFMLSGSGEARLEDVVAVVFGVAVVELLELEDVLEVVEYEWPLLIVYMYLLKLPQLPLLFEWLCVLLCHNLLNLAF